MKSNSPAAARNAGPILAALKRIIPPTAQSILEIAAGPGQHSAYFAPHFPKATWQPSDADRAWFTSIEAWRTETATTKLRAPLEIDVTSSFWRSTGSAFNADAIVCINMLHIAPWEAACGLFEGAARHLTAAGVLAIYGPFRVDGIQTSQGNADFDRSLRRQNESWGLRDVADVSAAAKENHLAQVEVIPMPANNLMLVFGRS